MNTFVQRSPGRICLLGDNTDLIEKPALAAAVSAYLTCELELRTDSRIILIGTDIDRQEEFELSDSIILDSPLRYTKAVINRLKQNIKRGFELRIRSEIPISAGLSSSTALCIASIRVIAEAFDIRMSAAETAELAYLVENHDLGVECGRMDQYAIAFGGVTYIHTGDNASAEPLHTRTLPILVADTQEKHDTKALQIWLRKRIAEQEPLLMNALTTVVDLVEEGKKAILAGDMEVLGKLMSAQQKEEKRMGTSTERLELFCSSAMKAGALGAKQMGAGGGGCMIALCPEQRIDAVKEALLAYRAPVWDFKVVSGEIR